MIYGPTGFDICGFTGAIFVVLNTKFKLVSFCKLITFIGFVVFVNYSSGYIMILSLYFYYPTG
jgi:hypothetical protein